MPVHQITAPTGLRTVVPLSADNGQPDRYTLIDMIRQASPALQLKAPVIATIDALLSCLPPKRGHNFVFASNATLAFRRNGISERTLRRHITQLAQIGFLVRSDSPNGKRFTKHDSTTGSVLRFGFNLEPLFLAFDRICALAKTCTDQACHLSFLRTRLRSAIANDPLHPMATVAQRALRRKLTEQDLCDWLDALEPTPSPASEEGTAVKCGTKQMAATGGQNDRHLLISEKEPSDLVAEKSKAADPAKHNPMTLQDLLTACPEAASYLQGPASSPGDVINHARNLAPMMGIDIATYQCAEDRLGRLGAAVSVWGLLQMQEKIQHPGAYFRAVTTGSKSASFDPWALIRRLVRQSRWSKSRIVRGQCGVPGLQIA